MLCVAHPPTLARKRRAREARAADRNADGPEDIPRRTACIAGRGGCVAARHRDVDTFRI
jgi:hypothetical protein